MIKIAEPILSRTERLIQVARTFSWLVDPRAYADNADVSIDRPIFLLGTQGGGLTLLSRMLRRHPDVVSAAGSARYWTSADEIQNVYGPVLPAELTGLRYKAPPHPVLTAPRSWTFAARELYGQYRKTEKDVTPAIEQALKRVIRYSLRRYGTVSGSPRFLDKSQSYSVRTGLIWRVLADTDPRFILVPRDPYVSVHRAAHGKAADMKRLEGTLDEAERIDICAEHYANTMRAAIEDADRLGFPLKIVRFEDLIEEPESVLRDCCEFVELGFRQDMLPAPDHRLPLGSRFRDRWYPIRSDANVAYEDSVTPHTVECVNRHCAGLFDRLGYILRDEPGAVGFERSATVSGR